MQTYDGFFIDQEGAVWSYEHGDTKWSPGRSEGSFYEQELSDKYGTTRQVGTVDKAVLSAMASLIESASKGELVPQGRRVAGMDSMTFSAYLHDPGQDMDREVLLSVRGSGAMQNAARAAKTLVSWLESVLSTGRASHPPDQGNAHSARPAVGTAKPGLQVIRKIPAAKPELKVEIKGPFPIDESSRSEAAQ